MHVFCIVLKDLNTPLSPSPVHKKEVLYWFCFPSPLQRKVMCSPISLLLQLLHPNLNRPDSRPDSLWKPVFSYYDRLKGNFSRIKINTSSQTVTYFFSFWMTVPLFNWKFFNPLERYFLHSAILPVPRRKLSWPHFRVSQKVSFIQSSRHLNCFMLLSLSL